MKPRAAPRTRTATWAGLTTLALAVALVFLPVPYVVETPGPTVDVLGSTDGVELIQVPDAPAHPITGELRLTTVSTRGANQDLTVGEAVAGWLSASAQVIPYEAAYPRSFTREQREQRSTQQMVSSQELAGVAALVALGLGVEMKVVEATGERAAAVLRAGDVLERIDGTPLRDFTQLLSVLEAIPAGSTIEIALRRDGAARTVRLTTEDDGAGGSRMGVMVGFALPIDVQFGVEGIGGSSAGLMFALGIVDKLGPVDLAADRIVAGTGTIDADGTVGPIGGIKQKLLGARRDGAEYFLAPADNCEEAGGAVPAGLTVVKVATLDEALAVLAQIRSGADGDLPVCD